VCFCSAQHQQQVDHHSLSSRHDRHYSIHHQPPRTDDSRDPTSQTRDKTTPLLSSLSLPKTSSVLTSSTAQTKSHKETKFHRPFELPPSSAASSKPAVPLDSVGSSAAAAASAYAAFCKQQQSTLRAQQSRSYTLNAINQSGDHPPSSVKPEWNKLGVTVAGGMVDNTGRPQHYEKGHAGKPPDGKVGHGGDADRRYRGGTTGVCKSSGDELPLNLALAKHSGLSTNYVGKGVDLNAVPPGALQFSRAGGSPRGVMSVKGHGGQRGSNSSRSDTFKDGRTRTSSGSVLTIDHVPKRGRSPVSRLDAELMQRRKRRLARNGTPAEGGGTPTEGGGSEDENGEERGNGGSRCNDEAWVYSAPIVTARLLLVTSSPALKERHSTEKCEFLAGFGLGTRHAYHGQLKYIYTLI